jgi:hypothetical protein
MTPEMFAEWRKPALSPAFIPWRRPWTPTLYGKHDPHSRVRYDLDVPPDYEWVDATSSTIAGWVPRRNR